MEKLEGIATDVIRAVMGEERVTQAELAGMMGYGSQSAVSGRLCCRNIGMDRVVAMLGAMGYEVVARKADGTGKKEWKITG